MAERTPERIVELQRRIADRMDIMDLGFLTPCWISNRVAQPNGYTKIGVNGRTWLTHRLSYELVKGPALAHLVVDHLCRHRACVNPEHLELVTNRENLIRGEGFAATQAAQTHCIHGHELTEANTYLRRDRTGRLCRACRREMGIKRNAKLRAQRRSTV